MGKIKRWAVADCETDPFEFGVSVEPFLWGLMLDNGDYFEFTDTNDFLDTLEQFDGIVWAHNGGKFDWLMPDVLKRMNPKKSLMIIDGRIAKAWVGRAQIRDSFLCFPVSLERMTGQKIKIDYEKFKKANRKKHMHEIKKYLKADCQALHNAMTKYIDSNGFTLTQAGASMQTWEKMGGEKRRYSKDHDTQFRPFYYGGRVQVFEYGAPVRGNFKWYDINSAYPYAMTHELPCGLIYKECTLHELKGAGFGIIRAISKGCLPYRDKKGRVTYPDDNLEREYWATGWEIHAGIDTGTLKVIGGFYLNPDKTENFGAFVERFINEKINAEIAGDKIGRELAKLTLNSLYGRYGMNPEDHQQFKLWPADQLLPDGWLHKVLAEPYCIICADAVSKTYYDVALAASVTGFTRAYLWRAICKSQSVVYCDTDAIVCESSPVEIHETKLGAWKCEGELSEFYVAGKKLYAGKLNNGKWKTASKGVRASAEDIIKIAKGETLNFNKDAPSIKLDGKQVFISRKVKRT